MMISFLSLKGCAMNKLRYQISWWIVRITPLMCATLSILGLLGIETLFKHSVVLGEIIAIFYAVLVIYYSKDKVTKVDVKDGSDE